MVNMKEQKIYMKNREEWRAWLEKNHLIKKVIWLIYYKKHTGKDRIPYEDAVEEAICFGWIDSTVKKIDEEKYMQKFTPRKDKSKWSEINIKRANKMIQSGKMVQAGLEKFNKKILYINIEKKHKTEVFVPDYIKDLLKNNKSIEIKFYNLAVSYRKKFVEWIDSAKKYSTKEKRMKEMIQLLKENKKLGMK